MARNLHPRKKLEMVFMEDGDKYALGTELVESLLMNVIENAAKHCDKPQGRIAVSIEEASRDGAKMWEIRVEDNGPGVPDEMKKKIFERYSRISKEKGMDWDCLCRRRFWRKSAGNLRGRPRGGRQGYGERIQDADAEELNPRGKGNITSRGRQSGDGILCRCH